MPTIPSLAKEIFEPRPARRGAKLPPPVASDPRGLARQIFATRSSNRFAWWSLASATALGSLLLFRLSSLETPPRPSHSAPIFKTRLNPPPPAKLLPPPAPKPARAEPKSPAVSPASQQPAKPSPKKPRARKARRVQRTSPTPSPSQTKFASSDKAPILDLSGQEPGIVQASGSAADGPRSGSSPARSGGSTGGHGLGSAGQGKGSRARGPGVRGAANWNCRWPQAASALESQEESVLVELSIDRQARIHSAKVIRDPGFGFGEEALRCARRQRYRPARNARGQAIGPRKIRLQVHFQRE